MQKILAKFRGRARSYTPHTSLTFWCIFNHVGIDTNLSASYVVGLPLV